MDFETVLNSIENLPASKKIDLQEAYYCMAKERDTALEQAKEASTRADALTIDKALSESAFIRDKVSKDPIRQGYVREHFRSAFKVEQGRVVAYTREGVKMFNGQGQPCTVDEAIARFISLSPFKDSLLDRSGAAGAPNVAGVQHQQAGAKRMPRSQFDRLNPREQMAAVKAGFTFYDD